MFKFKNLQKWNKYLEICIRLFNITSLLALCVFIISSGCTTANSKRNMSKPDDGQITIFLNGPDHAAVNITFDLLAVNIITEDGIPRSIISAPLSINSIDVEDRQILLGERFLPEGRYKKLELKLEKASIKRKDQIADLALPPEGIEIPIDITVKRRHNVTLFLIWNSEASIVDGYLFKPLMTVKGEVPELSSLLIYVTNEDSDNVSVINRQTGEVVSTIMVGNRPRGIAVNSRKDRLRVYVANSASNSVSVINPTTNTVENEIPIRFGREQEGIAVARASHIKDLIFVTNYNSNSVSVVDSSNYQEIEKVNVGDGPIAVAVDPPFESLIGTSFLSQVDINTLRDYRERFLNVYVANRNSKYVSVLKFDILKNRCEEVIDLEVEWSPVALSVDYQRGNVYVANYGSDKLSVIDILQIVRGNETGAVRTIDNVGTFVIGAIADPTLDRIYLLKEVSGEIQIIRPSFDSLSTLKTVIPPTVGIITVGDSPRSLILDPEIRKIYVVNRVSNNVSVIDRTTRREERVIPVGNNPYGITMFP